jgi:nucleoside-diphosphate-sugar epimerase
MSRVAIVTGANGWLGKTLSSFLANGHPDNKRIQESIYDEVRCLVLDGEDVSTLESFSLKIKVIRGDITKIETLDSLFENSQDSDVYHTAGIIHPNRVKDFYRINLEGTENILNTAIKWKSRKAVIVSSNSPIGCNPFPEHLFDESSPYNPYMNYGRSKMLMEKSASKLAEKNNLSVTFIRCPWFYGPNQPARQTLFFQMIKDGKMPIVGDGENRRSMSYIDNLCQGIMLAALFREKCPTAYWIADDQPYTMNKIVDTVEDVLAKDFGYSVTGKRVRLPWIVGEIATLVDWFFNVL